MSPIEQPPTQNPFIMNCLHATAPRTRRTAPKWKAGLLGAALALGAPAIGQTVLIDPAGDGGFVNGPTFAANNWNLANSASVNQWYLGNLGLAGHNGDYAYISNDVGVTNSFTNSAATVSHIWRDVTIPAGETQVTLSFTWAAQGETSFFDGIMVSIAPTSYTVTGSTTSLGTGLLAAPAVTFATLWAQSTVQTATITSLAAARWLAINGPCMTPPPTNSKRSCRRAATGIR